MRNPHQKRGLAITPVKFGISFTATFYNQAGAVVLVYRDGTVQVNHGGTEMGQGLYTKILQVAAEKLGVPLLARARDVDADGQGAEHLGDRCICRERSQRRGCRGRVRADQSAAGGRRGRRSSSAMSDEVTVRERHGAARGESMTFAALCARPPTSSA